MRQCSPNGHLCHNFYHASCARDRGLISSFNFMKDFFLREKNLLTIFYISYLHFFTSTIKTFCPEHFRKKIIKQDFILNFFKLYISNFSKKNMQYEEKQELLG